MTAHDLQLGEERLQMVLEGSELGFWDWDIESCEVVRNDRWAQILGYATIKDFDNNTDTWTNSIHPDDRDAAWASINEHKDGGSASHKMEYRMLTKGGGYKWILDHAKVVQRDDSGRALRMSGTHSDISERKELEQERDNLLHSLEDALRKIKRLEGIIPICGYCHQIRNSEGAWDKLETYISEHSGASFSHGICPQCKESVLAELEPE